MMARAVFILSLIYHRVILLIYHQFFIVHVVLLVHQYWVSAIRSVSCVPTTLTPLTVLPILLTGRPRTTMHLHLCYLSCSLV